jgi:hypothetical protein
MSDNHEFVDTAEQQTRPGILMRVIGYVASEAAMIDMSAQPETPEEYKQLPVFPSNFLVPGLV